MDKKEESRQLQTKEIVGHLREHSLYLALLVAITWCMSLGIVDAGTELLGLCRSLSEILGLTRVLQ